MTFQRVSFLMLLFTAAAVACKPADGEAWAYLSGSSTDVGSAGYDASVPSTSYTPTASVDASTSADGGVDNDNCGCGIPPSTPSGEFSDAAAPLPPPPNGAGFNAIYVAADKMVYVPLFSTPSCDVVPPYGESYYAAFTPICDSPTGVYPSCFSEDGQPTSTASCYTPGRTVIEGERNDENIKGGLFGLSAFDASGIATGAMDTKEGRIALTVKYCP